MNDDVQEIDSKKGKGQDSGLTPELEEMHEDLLEWLAQLRFPETPGAKGWHQCVRIIPPAPDDEETDVGVKVRLAFRLFTPQNQYLVSIMECLSPEDRDVHILTVHVNWKKGEWEKQKRIDEAYGGRFVDALRGRHSVWTQTFRKGEIHSALDAAAIAILGHELVGTPPDMSVGKPIKLTYPAGADFPSADDDE